MVNRQSGPKKAATYQAGRLLFRFSATAALLLLVGSIVSAQTEYCLTTIQVRERQTSVTLTWNHDGSSLYSIFRSTTGPHEGFSPIATTGSDYSLFMDTTVSVNRMYYYKIESANGCISPVVNVMPRARTRNRPPVFGSDPVTVAASEQPYSYQVEATDPDRNPLDYYLDVAPDGMTIDNAGMITWIPQQQQAGSVWVGIRVTDGYLCAVQYFQVNVAAGNQPPEITAVPDQMVEEGATVDIAVSATDPDGDILQFFSVGLPAFGEFFDLGSGNSTLNVSPGFDAAGSYPLMIIVSDGELFDTTEFTLTVNDVNRPPVAAADSYTTNENTSLTVAAPGTLGNDSDPDGDVLTALVATQPEHGTVILETDGGFSYIPESDFFGNDVFSYYASDGLAQSDVTSVAIGVLSFRIDLAPTDVDAAGVNVDPQTLVMNGTVTVTLTNQGTTSATITFTVLLFEDVILNGVFDSGSDVTLGSTSVNGLGAGESVTLEIAVSGTSLFKGNLIYAFVDSENSIDETDEENNIGHSMAACVYEPPVGEFDPVLEWSKEEFALHPSSHQVMMTPNVVNLTDDNGDGRIDLDDIPDIVFITYDESYSYYENGYLRSINGQNGSDIFTIEDYRFFPVGNIASGDIDGDGLVEIIAMETPNTATHMARFIALENDGQFKWASESIYINYDAPQYEIPSIAIADLEGDGSVEIIVGAHVLRSDGSLWWSGNAGNGKNTSNVADINNDGTMEVITANTVYDHDGSVVWHNPEIANGYSALGNFDEDDFPEIVVVKSAEVYLLEHNGDIKWGPVSLPGSYAGYAGPGGPPVLADVDGDGEPEIGVSGYQAYTCFETDGSMKWTQPIFDRSSITGSSVFDFDGDGNVEIVYTDEEALHIYSGNDGAILFEYAIGSGTILEIPVVADVDNDGNAEIVVIGNSTGVNGRPGIFVFGDANDTWVNTRKIWNQHAYSITNVNEDGTIPINPEPSWLAHNTFRCNISDDALACVDLTASYIRASTGSITARIGNGGALHIPGELDVAVYNGNPENGGTLLGTVKTSGQMQPGQFEDVTLSDVSLSPGRHEIWIVADDDGTGSGKHREIDEENNRSYVVVNINSPPVFTSRPVTCILEDQQYTYDVDAEDPDGDALSFTIEVFPQGMTIDRNSGMINWNPEEVIPSEIDLYNGLVAYYAFDGNANDLSGKGNHGTVANAILTTDRCGNENAAFQFNGVNSYIDMGNDPSVNIENEIALCAWVQSSDHSQFGNVISKIQSCNHGGNYRLLYTSEGYEFYYYDGVTQDKRAYIEFAHTYNWEFAVVTYNYSTHELHAVINGIARNFRWNTPPVSDSAILTENPLWIGADRVYSNNSSCSGMPVGAPKYVFNGKIDDIRIYNRVLSDEEIRYIYGQYPVTVRVEDTYGAYNEQEFTVNVIKESVNRAPIVNAGPDQTITLPATATLSGSATDDGLPNPPGQLTYLWRQVSGPGIVTFADSLSVNITAAFSGPGEYNLILIVSDSELFDTDTITITVNQIDNLIARDDYFSIIGNSGDCLNLSPGFTCRILVQGVPFSEISSLCYSDESKLYVADIGNKSIFEIDISNLSINRRFQGLPLSFPSRMIFGGEHKGFEEKLLLADWNTEINRSCCDGAVVAFDTSTWQYEVITNGNPAYPPAGDPFALAFGTEEFGSLLFVMDEEGASPNPPVLYTIDSNWTAETFLTNTPKWHQSRNPFDIVFSQSVRFGQAAYVADHSSDNEATIIWKILPDKSMDTFFVAPNSNQFFQLRFGPGGTWGNSLYTINGPYGQILQIDSQGNSTEWASGLNTPVGYSLPDFVFSNDMEKMYVAISDIIYEITSDSTMPIDLHVNSPGILSNDSIGSSNDISIILIQTTQHGKLVYYQNGAISYRPNPGFYGEDNFSYAAVVGSDTSNSATVHINVGMNSAPIVSAGPDILHTTDDPVQLAGAASDDGLPFGTLTTAWRNLSGPGAAVFDDTTILQSTTTASASGMYHMELFASDGELGAADSMLLCASEPNAPFFDDFDNGVIDGLRRYSTACHCNHGIVGEENGLFFTGQGDNPGSSEHKFFATFENYSPFGEGVVAKARIRFNGDFQNFGFGLEAPMNSNYTDNLCIRFYTGERPTDPPNTIFLHVAEAITSDSWNSIYLVNVPMTWYEFHTLSIEWRLHSAHFFIDDVEVGQTLVPIGCNQELTIANARPQLMEVDWVSVWQIGINTPPVVDAGSNQTITLPLTATLTGSATDDGLPNPPGQLTYLWRQVSGGPGTVAFGDSLAIVTVATFNDTGEYTLIFRASDSELSEEDTITITVYNPVPVANNDTIYFPATATSPDGPEVVDPRFKIDRYYEVPYPIAIEKTSSQSAFGNSIYSIGFPPETQSNQEPPDTVYRIDIDSATLTVFYVLPGESDPHQIEMGNGTSFPENLFICANNRDGNLYGDQGGAIQMLEADPSVNGEILFTPLESNYLSEPACMVFGEGGGWDSSLFVTNTTDPPFAIYRLNLAGQKSIYVPMNTVQSNRWPTMEFIPGGALQRGLYLSKVPDFQSISIFDSLAQSTHFTTVPFVDEIDAIEYSQGTTFPAGLYVTGVIGKQLFVAFIDPTGKASIFASGFYGISSTETRTDCYWDNLHLDEETGKLYVSDYYDSKIYVIGFDSLTVGHDISSNDVLPSGVQWQFEIVELTNNGYAAIDTAGKLFYKPAPQFEGVDTVRYCVSNSSGITDTAEVIVVVQTNDSPITNAGPDQTITLPEQVQLSGMANDDGLPQGSILATTWQQLSGPEEVTIPEPYELSTTINFTLAGEYTFHLIATDSELSDTDTVIITVNPAPVPNTPPVAEAGDNQTITLPQEATLSGSFADDGLPVGITVQLTWELVSGPGTVEFANTHSAITTATFSIDGSYTLRLIAFDSEYSDTDMVTITVQPEVIVNQPPVVSAGNDTTVPINLGLALQASYTDDGLPEGGHVTFQWYFASGPAQVGIDDDTILQPHATFSVQGEYVLALDVSDGELVTRAFITITIDPPENIAPVVDAGSDDTAFVTRTITVNASATDDGLPNPPGTVSYLWSEITSNPAVVISDPALAHTSVTFSDTGIFTLTCSASDGELAATDTVFITVIPLPMNSPPTVFAGNDQTIQLPAATTLSGSANDDGIPAPLSYVWRSVSGPGAVTFTDSTQQTTEVAFSTGGLYRIALIVTDSDLSAADTVAVMVYNLPDGEYPVAELTFPLDTSTITKPDSIIGTASDANLFYYMLAYRMKGDNSWTDFDSGTTGVTGNILGSFDPTLLRNGMYEMRLTVVDMGGLSATATRSFKVDGGMKLGHLAFGKEDLSVKTPGLPLSLVREYDSRIIDGDFGPGWSLPQKSVQVATTSEIGEGWLQYTEQVCNFVCVDYFVLRESTPHEIVIRLSDTEVERFGVTVSPSQNPLIQISEVTVSFVPLGKTLSALSVVDYQSTALVEGTGQTRLLNSNGQPWNPSRFRLTTRDGTVYIFSTANGIESVTDVYGNTVTYSSNAISHSCGSAISFTRDVSNHIVESTDNLGRTIRYEYENGALARVIQVQAGGQPVNNLLEAYTPEGLRSKIREIRAPDGTVLGSFEYNFMGKLTGMLDANGNRVIYGYDLPNQQQTVTDRLGNATVYTYDTRGNVTRKQDPMGYFTEWVYDADDNMISETGPLGNTTTKTYNAKGELLNESDGLGRTTSYTYDNSGNVLTSVDPMGFATINSYDAHNNLLSTTDALGNTTSYLYDAAGNQTATISPDGDTSFSYYDSRGNLTGQRDPTGAVSEYTYDLYGNQLSESRIRTIAGVPDTITTRNVYDSNNRLTTSFDAYGDSTMVEYNDFGKQTATIDKAGRRTEYRYDTQGNQVVVIHPDGARDSTVYDAEGRRVEQIDRNNNSTRFVYDKLGRLVKTISPDTLSDSTVYDAGGRTIATINAQGARTAYLYEDGCGCSNRRTAVINALGDTTRFTYDENGNQLTMRDARGNTTTFVYDSLNRRVKTVYPDGTFDSTTFDIAGRMVAKTDQAGITTCYEYDRNGRLVTVVDAYNQRTEYTYDELGNQLTQTDAHAHTTTFAYDKLGRRISRTLPMGMSEYFTYGADGNMATKTDFNGNTTVFDYDTSGRLLRGHPDPAMSEPDIIYTYTPDGKRESMTDMSGTTRYVYDNRDRLVQKQTPQGTLEYTYNHYGQLETIGSQHVNGVSMHYAYDLLGRLEQAIDERSDDTTRYFYDHNGSLEDVRYGNGVEHTYTYNLLNRLTELTVQNGAGPIARYTYTLSPTGNRNSVAELNGRTITYAYDSLYRLVSETIINSPQVDNNGTIGYIYDPVGNRMQRTSTVAGIGNQAFDYDANDRLTSHTYDNNGNTLNDGVNACEWDFENRMVALNGGSVRYLYNGDGIRVAKIEGVDTTNYLVDDKNHTGYAQVVEEVRQGVVQKRYAFGLDLVSQTDLGGAQPVVSYYVYDGHGSVRMLTDASGSVTDEYDYEGFGGLIRHVGSTGNEFLYTGEHYDESVGGYYLRARWYREGVGRFMGMDPLMSSQVFSRFLHPYTYAKNAPTVFDDPNGEITLAEVSIALSIDLNLQSIYLKKSIGILLKSAKIGYCVIEPAKKMRDFAIRASMAGAGGWASELEEAARMQMSAGFKQISSSIAGGYIEMADEVQNSMVNFDAKVKSPAAEAIGRFALEYYRLGWIRKAVGIAQFGNSLINLMDKYGETTANVIGDPSHCNIASFTEMAGNVLAGKFIPNMGLTNQIFSFSAGAYWVGMNEGEFTALLWNTFY